MIRRSGQRVFMLAISPNNPSQPDPNHTNSPPLTKREPGHHTQSVSEPHELIVAARELEECKDGGPQQ